MFTFNQKNILFTLIISGLVLCNNAYAKEKIDCVQLEKNVHKIEKKAEKNANETFFLGEKYYWGDCIKQDYKTAFGWFQKSAAEQHLWAQYYIGRMYEDGQSVKQSFTDAVKWYKKSAKQGYGMAQLALAAIYLTGKEEVKQDYLAAYVWGNYALIQNGDRDPFLLQSCIDTIQFASARMTEEEYEKAEKMLKQGQFPE
ncbi:tetratricopeptide repeat protein [Pasteurella skyensis]|uniref:tetratricopeptide repeat protein n=1 Tax=Phocoenobacter skyensis TaxID=97481 RepID=UPI00278CED91|nr:tetratricopeptide repeat protein [Pasteurella skyensis]MDP8170634.1 tetratricopeptide repeat protein [Pasteurella skyensis]